MMMNVIVCSVAALSSALIIRLLIAYAQKLGLVQAPVARSSHKKPTPTGGGIGIVIGSLIAGVFFTGTSPVLLGICGLGFVMAFLGLIDDRTPLPARIRFLAQTAVVAGVIILSGVAVGLFGPVYAVFWPIAAILLLLGGAWWINLFNFMDGIDGMAGQQALLMTIFAMIIMAGNDSMLSVQMWWMMAATSSAVFAFLLFNWPPARIFMGDAGSTFLAFMLFAFASISIANGWMTVAHWLVLASLFAVDATVTLMIRFFRHENVTQAHRSHAYQRLSRRFGGALPVTTAAAAFNLVVVLPLAVWLPEKNIPAYAVVFGLYLAVAIGCLWAGAGLRDEQAGGHFDARRRQNR